MAPRGPRGTRHIECAIAGTRVTVALRRRSDAAEPGRLYVRCEERDCQYADVNEPPCPLGIAMFRDRTDEVVADCLTALGGRSICYACVRERVSLPHDAVRAAVARLLTPPDTPMVVHIAACTRCGAKRLTIQWRTPAGEGAHDAAAEIADALLRAPTVALCASCLAFATNRARADAAALVEMFRRDQRFALPHAACSKCRRVRPVVVAAPARGTA